MSRKLSLDEEDAIASLLSVRCRRKRSLKSEDSTNFDSDSMCSDKVIVADSTANSDPDNLLVQPFQFEQEEVLNLTTSNDSTKKNRKPPIKKKMSCQCGAVILVRTEWRHKKSNKHIRFMLRKSQLEAQQKQTEADSLIPALLPLPEPSQHQQQQGERVQQEGSQPPPQLALSQHIIGSIFAQKFRDTDYIHGHRSPIPQHHGFGGPNFRPHAQENQALNVFGLSGQLGLEQQLGGWIGSDIEPFPSLVPQFTSRQQELRRHPFLVDRPVVSEISNHAGRDYHGRPLLLDRYGTSILYGYGLGQQQSVRPTAVPAPQTERQWQCYGMPTVPTTGFCGRDSVTWA